MAVKRILGIDFGTSSSIVKVKTYKDGEPLGAKEHVESIRFDAAPYCPTLIYKADEGSLFFGHRAENAAVRGVLVQNFKMDLVSGDSVKKAVAREYTQLFFNYLYEAYNESKSLFPPCDEEITYVSYPAKWPEAERGAMIEIAKKAGFVNVAGIDEPSAAVHAIMVSANDRLIAGDKDEINILLVDMGAGTTDLVLCKYSPYADSSNGERQIEILNAYPKANSGLLLGGREIDAALCGYVKEYLVDCGLPNPKNFNEKYMDKCRVWKETNVSPVLNDNGTVRYAGFIDALLSMMDIDKDFPPLSREGFENMLFEYISQLPKLINGCLNEVDFKAGDVDYVVLTGGHSQWYFVENVINGTADKFGGVNLPCIKQEKSLVIRLPWPQETVALGMVFQDIAVARRNRPSSAVVKILQIISERYKSARGRDIYIDIMADPIASRRLRSEAENAAKMLERAGSATVAVTFLNTATGATEKLNEEIRREDIENDSSEPPKTGDKVPCPKCGKLMAATGRFCGHCRFDRESDKSQTNSKSDSSKQTFTPQNGEDKRPAETKFCGNCGKKIDITVKTCSHCGYGKPSQSARDNNNTSPAETKFCGGCGKKIDKNADVCPHCGRGKAKQTVVSTRTTDVQTPTPKAPAPPPASQFASGNLLKTISASRYRGIRQVGGHLSIYPHRIEFKPSIFPVPMPGDKQELQMSEIARADRCTIMAMNVGVKLTLRNGKTDTYSVGTPVLGGANPQEIVDLINAQIR